MAPLDGKDDAQPPHTWRRDPPRASYPPPTVAADPSGGERASRGDPAAVLAAGLDGRAWGEHRVETSVNNGAGRAGRDLPAALAVGGGLAALALASLLLWRPAFLAVIVAAVALAVWEMVRAVRAVDVHPPLLPLLAGGVATPVMAWFWGPGALSLALLVTVLVVMVWRLGGGAAGYLRDLGAATLVTVYVPMLAGFAALLAAAPDGHWRMLAMLGVVVLCDTGGYVAGVFFGRRPLAPAISPKKSWEGLIGSLVAASAGGAIGLALIFQVDWWWGALFGLVVAGAAVLGDLVESLLKRDLGVKDMSGLLPGHGGVMDRVDSILFAAPTAYLLLAVLAG